MVSLVFFFRHLLRTDGASYILAVHCRLECFSYPEILLFFSILSNPKLTLLVCVFVCVWMRRLIGCYWVSFQCDCAVETEIQAQVGSDLRLSYCLCVMMWNVLCDCSDWILVFFTEVTHICTETKTL